jgi:hypothetical protein
VIAGTVQNALGTPQLGATILLFDNQQRPIQRVLSDARGKFQFAGLLPDHYFVTVVLDAFFPVLKKEILVQPGTRSLLSVHLSSILSTIELSYPPMENGSLMTDDWKWVLRTATSTRPVMRFLGDTDATASDRPFHSPVFSDTRALFTLSAGEGGTTTAVANEADMGTAFALATSMFGNSTLQVSGNFGYGSQTGVPVAAFRTTYSRDVMGGNPQFSLTMRELFLPSRLGAALSGSENALPMLRTMSGSFDDRTHISDDIILRYGVTMDSVTFLDRMNYVSPYAQLTYALGDGSALTLTFTSGNARPELSGSGDSADLQADVTALGMFPRISLREAQTRVQRGDEYEVTYSRKIGSRTYSGTVYHESVSNAALTVVGPAGVLGGSDILPDIFSDSSIFNAGNFQSTGYTAAVTQNLGDHVSATVMYGSVGALTTDARELSSNNAEELREMLHEGRRNVATTRVAATVPGTHTRIVASYQWAADHRWATPGNEYSTQSSQPTPGLNLCVHQPIPGFARRVEATADIRNMLAQGYLPVGMVGGQQLMLVETARSLRGGLAFIF